MADDSLLSYLIWPGGNDPAISHGSLELRRRIAAQLATGKRAFPKTKGEGLTYLGESIGEGMQYLGLQRAEAARQANLEKQAKDLYPPTKTTTEPAPAPSGRTSYAPEDPPPTVTTDDTTAPPPVVVAAPEEPAPTPVVVAPVEPAPGPQSFNDRYSPAVEPPPGVTRVPTGAPASFAERFGFAGPSAPPASFADRFGPVGTSGAQATSAIPDKSMFFSPQMQSSMIGGDMVDVPAAPVRTQAMIPIPASAVRGAPVAEDPPPETRAENPWAGQRVPLPMGDPRTTSGVRSTMEAVASQAGMTPTAIAGLQRNVRDESNFDPNLRHPDQPGFSGEAHYAHGLYQEGGDEWNNYVKWINKNAPGSDWRDPKLQTQFLMDRMQDPSRPDYNRTFARMNEAPNSGVAANEFLRGYLKPAAPYMATRSAQYLRDGGAPTYTSRSVPGGGDPGATVAGGQIAGAGRTGGAPMDERDAIAIALMQAQQQQAQPAQPAMSEADASAEDRIGDVTGMGGRRPGSPIFAPTAMRDRAGIVSDAPRIGLTPMGSLGGGIDQSIEQRRNAISDALQRQPTAPEGPPVNPTLPGTIPSPTTGLVLPTSASTVSSPSPVISDIQPAPVGAPGDVLAQARAQAQPPPPPPASMQSPRREFPPPPDVASPAFQRPVPALPVAPRETPRSEQELRLMRMRAMNPGDPDVAAMVDPLLALEAEKRKAIDARNTEKYKSDLQLYNKLYPDYLQSRADAPKQAVELAAKNMEQEIRARNGGVDPGVVFSQLEKDKSTASKQANVLTQINIAKQAIQDGVITGTASGLRVNSAKLASWMLNNKASGDLASNTERLEAALKSMLSVGVENFQGTDSKVTDSDIRVASGTIGADPRLQLDTIKKIMSENERIARQRLNDYEDKKHFAIGGTNADHLFSVTAPETAPSRVTARLLENRDNPTYIKDYNEKFGVGAAELEIARAQRRAEVERYRSGRR